MAKKRKPGKPVPRERRGQVDSEKARFDLGPDARVIGDALGTPPPGYGLTIVRGFVRDPKTVVAVWDVNDEATVTKGEKESWKSLAVQVEDEEGNVLARALVGKRAGVFHLGIGVAGATVVVRLGFERPDGSFSTVARSAPLRMPPDASFRAETGETWVRVAPGTDLRRIVAIERPAQPGHELRPHASSASQRLTGRLRLARELGPRAAASTGEEAGEAGEDAPSPPPADDEPPPRRSPAPAGSTVTNPPPRGSGPSRESHASREAPAPRSTPDRRRARRRRNDPPADAGEPEPRGGRDDGRSGRGRR